MSALDQLRKIMKLNKCEALLIPRTDQFQSQNISKNNEQVAFISGFTGSVATAFVSQNEALLWTDGRYYLQAEKQLLPGWKMKKIQINQQTWYQYIVDKYQQLNIQVNYFLIPILNYQLYNNYFNQKNKKIQLIEQKQNYIDIIWKDKPQQNFRQWFMHQQWSAQTALQKLEWIHNSIKKLQAQRIIMISLSQISWTLNIKSSQIPYLPFFKGYFYYQFGEINKGYIFIIDQNPNFTNLNKDVQKHLSSLNIQIEKKSKMKQLLSQIQEPICLSKKKCNLKIFKILKKPVQWEGVQLKKQVKKQKQLKGLQESHKRDAIALNKYFAILNKKLLQGQQIGQYDSCQVLRKCREQMIHFQSQSFHTISATGPNGAIIHYKPTKQNQAIIKKSQIYLCDSGAQYLDGTTDVTRTYHFGESNDEQKDSYTRVLLGNLDIERLIFPQSSKITGSDIEVLARRYLWEKGLDYKHGTGHGIGYFSDVHQYPLRILKGNSIILQPGMMVTDQPGYYKKDCYGIRIQNVLEVIKVNDNFLGFKNITLSPYDRNLIDINLLKKNDIDYINQYHKNIYQTLKPQLLKKNDELTLNWLQKMTKQL